GKYNFGSVVMGQADLFDADHVQMIARFDSGDVYQASDLEDLRRALIATGLVSTITIDPVVAEEPDAVDIAVNVTPAPLRTIAGELGYGTGEGARAEVSWEHRNMFPPEGLIRMTGVLATQEQSGSIAYRRNNYRRRDNVLNGRTALSVVDRPAFKAQTFSVAANIERQSNLIYQKRWSWSVGIELLASREKDVTGPTGATGRDTFFIGSLPGLVTYDASDDLLDPSRGFRLSGRIAPEASLQNGSFFYVRSQLDGSAYFPASEKITLAGRARFGSIVGAGNNRIAPSRRLYSGGGGSVRGYSYQSIGPRDANNDPVGGRSLVEFSLEARVKTGLFGGNLGVVPFIDAGNVYTSSSPDFKGLRYGAGLGVRYYSDFGPIRIDVGTPINPQPGDSRVAVYVSLGQAF
ncbi:MAG: BamA/TamA family outer membrane protein, partial [Parasphingorhabdus sp.]